MKRNVVVIHPGTLGDVLLAVPAIKRVASRFPQHHLLLIARGPISRLLAECHVVDEWIATESQVCSGLFTGFGEQSVELRSSLERCDVAVAWTVDVDGSLVNLLREYGVRKIWIQSPFSPALRRTHQRDRFLETIEEGSPTGLGEDVLDSPDHLIEEGRICLAKKGITKGRSLVLIHPGSGSIHKCLGPEKWAHIIQQLQYREMSPVVLEGPADQDAVESVLSLLSTQPPVLRDLSLSLLVGVLVQADLYVGNDSGVTHLAAIVGVRTAAVFGPTDPHRWAPSGRHVTILRGASCVCPTWDAVKTCHGKPCLDLDVEEILTVL
ncbi:MAG: glycosyltransferase family 9 protein [Nitrospira sp.]|nr:glycosyltransferase family 9 protein [Nitrospira sp.]MDH4244166.1 glycosyltransferase family 9 protein [Nitrospira sp.]